MKTRTVYLPILGELSDKTPCAINIPFGFELDERGGVIGLVRNGAGVGLGVDWRNHIGDPTPGELRYESHADDPVWPLPGKKPHNAIGPINSAGEDLPEPETTAGFIDERDPYHHSVHITANEVLQNKQAYHDRGPRKESPLIEELEKVRQVQEHQAAQEQRARMKEAEDLVDFIRQEVSEIMATRPANEIVVRVVVEDRRNG